MRPVWLLLGLGPLLALFSWLGPPGTEAMPPLPPPAVALPASDAPPSVPEEVVTVVRPEPAVVEAPLPAPNPAPVAEAPPEPDPVLSGYRIEIPKAGISYMVQPDIGNPELEAGPGHYPRTALPGEAGNAAIAGHRTYGGKPSYFYHLDRLAAGDQILITYPDRQVRYTVEEVFVTTPFNLGVLDPTPYPALTLTTCDPPGTEEKRLIVRARLD